MLLNELVWLQGKTLLLSMYNVHIWSSVLHMPWQYGARWDSKTPSRA